MANELEVKPDKIYDISSGALNIVDLSPELSRKWEDTIQLMTWTCPGWRHLFYRLLANNNGKWVALFTRQVPIAATDGKNILLNPDTFFKFKIKVRVFILAHEITHCMYNDMALFYKLMKQKKVVTPTGRVLDFDDDILQHAADYRINDLLVEGKVGQIDPGFLHNPDIGTYKDSVLDIYERLYDLRQKQPQGGQGQGSQGQGKIKPQRGSGNGKETPGQGSFDKVLKPGATTGEQPQEAINGRSEEAWKGAVQVAKSLEEKARGSLPGALGRVFDEILEPQVPWTDHIEGFAKRRIGSGSYDFRRSDKRLIQRDIYSPGRTGFGCNWIVVWGDTSGSITSREMNQYLGELSGIIEDLRPKRLTVLFNDAALHQINELEDAADLHKLRTEGIKGGGGGTDCRPVFKWIDEHMGDQPDAFIGLTDAEAAFPSHEPTYPCVWAVSGNATPPWGETVRIKPKRYGDDD